MSYLFPVLVLGTRYFQLEKIKDKESELSEQLIIYPCSSLTFYKLHACHQILSIQKEANLISKICIKITSCEC